MIMIITKARVPEDAAHHLALRVELEPDLGQPRSVLVLLLLLLLLVVVVVVVVVVLLSLSLV